MQKEPMTGSCPWCSFTLTALDVGTFRDVPYYLVWGSRWTQWINRGHRAKHTYSGLLLLLFSFFFSFSINWSVTSLHSAGPDCCPVPVWPSDPVRQAGGVLQHVWPRYANTSKIVYDDLHLSTFRFRAYWRAVHKWEPPIAECVKWRRNDARDEAALKYCPHFKMNPKALSVVTVCLVGLLLCDYYSFTLYTLRNCLNPTLVAALYPGGGWFKIFSASREIVPSYCSFICIRVEKQWAFGGGCGQMLLAFVTLLFPVVMLC